MHSKLLKMEALANRGANLDISDEWRFTGNDIRGLVEKIKRNGGHLTVSDFISGETLNEFADMLGSQLTVVFMIKNKDID